MAWSKSDGRRESNSGQWQRREGKGRGTDNQTIPAAEWGTSIGAARGSCRRGTQEQPQPAATAATFYTSVSVYPHCLDDLGTLNTKYFYFSHTTCPEMILSHTNQKQPEQDPDSDSLWTGRSQAVFCERQTSCLLPCGEGCQRRQKPEVCFLLSCCALRVGASFRSSTCSDVSGLTPCSLVAAC